MAKLKLIYNGGPAFPYNPAKVDHFPGMSLRDYFAAAALQGLTVALRDMSSVPNAKSVAAGAYCVADAMLAARETPSTEQPHA